MRRGVPEPEGVRAPRPDLVVGAHLPGAVVEIHQAVEHRRLHAARRRDLARRSRRSAAGRWCRSPTGFHCAAMRSASASACARPVGQRQFGAAAKAGGLDALDMAVTGEEELGHAAVRISGRRQLIPPRVIPSEARDLCACFRSLARSACAVGGSLARRFLRLLLLVRCQEALGLLARRAAALEALASGRPSGRRPSRPSPRARSAVTGSPFFLRAISSRSASS